jgi:hypothetical protein
MGPGGKITPLFLAIALSAPFCRAQSLKAMVATDAALTTADIITSGLIQSRPGGYEQNPLMPRHPSTALMAGEIAGGNILWDLAVRKISRWGYRRTAKVMLWAGVADETYCVAHNSIKLQSPAMPAARFTQMKIQTPTGVIKH